MSAVGGGPNSAPTASGDHTGQIGEDALATHLNRAESYHQARQYELAIREYRAALALDEHSWPAITGHNRAVRHHVPRWHFEMMHDRERAASYELALTKIISPEHLVLDIGTGSGMLALMAVRAGAHHVVACEAQPIVAEIAQRTVRRARRDSQITVIPKRSTDLLAPADLSRRADVLVTETVDCGLLGEGILASIAHAREHLLTETAVIVPGKGQVFAKLVESVSLFRKNHVGELYGFDLSEFNQLSSMEYFDSRLRNHEHRSLSTPFKVFDFDFYRDGPASQRKNLLVTPNASGACHAIVFWFELDLAPGVSITNAPDHPTTHWKQAIQVLPKPMQVLSGTPLSLDVRHDGQHIHFAVAAADETGR